jgi:hypothetical protein
MSDFKVGDEVDATRRIWEPASDDHPGGLLTMPGEKLIVREVRGTGQWPISVSHEGRTDGMTFSVAADEIKPWTPATVATQTEEPR